MREVGSGKVKTALAKLDEFIAHEHDWITKDQSRRSIAWDYTPCFDSDGAVKYVIGIGNDITSKTPAQLEAQNRLLEARAAQPPHP